MLANALHQAVPVFRSHVTLVTILTCKISKLALMAKVFASFVRAGNILTTVTLT